MICEKTREWIEFQFQIEQLLSEAVKIQDMKVKIQGYLKVTIQDMKEEKE